MTGTPNTVRRYVRLMCTVIALILAVQGARLAAIGDDAPAMWGRLITAIACLAVAWWPRRRN